MTGMEVYTLGLGSLTKRWQLKYLFIFNPTAWEVIQFDEHNFSDRLVQPPTSLTL